MAKLEMLQEYGRFAPLGEFVFAQTVSQVLAAQGDAEKVYYVGDVTEGIEAIIGKCRMVVDGMDALLCIQKAASAVGVIQKVGLRMVPDDFDDGRKGIRFADLAKISHEAKKLDAVTIRGCFVNGSTDHLHGKALGKYFRAAYNCAKQMTVVLPCAMPYLCVENALSALKRNQTEHPETLDECLTAAQIVAMQNETAFYATLLLK